MSIEEKLKDLIVSRYGTMQNFSKKVGIPNSTLASIMIRGINNASITNVIKICSELGISTDGVACGEVIPLEIEVNEKIAYTDLTELTSFVRTTCLENIKTMTVNGLSLSREDVMSYLDMVEASSTIIWKKLQRKNEKKKAASK